MMSETNIDEIYRDTINQYMQRLLEQNNKTSGLCEQLI